MQREFFKLQRCNRFTEVEAWICEGHPRTSWTAEVFHGVAARGQKRTATWSSRAPIVKIEK